MFWSLVKVHLVILYNMSTVSSGWFTHLDSWLLVPWCTHFLFSLFIYIICSYSLSALLRGASHPLTVGFWWQNGFIFFSCVFCCLYFSYNKGAAFCWRCCEGRRTPWPLAFGGTMNLFFSLMFFAVFTFVITKQLLLVGCCEGRRTPWLLAFSCLILFPYCNAII